LHFVDFDVKAYVENVGLEGYGV